MNWVQQFFVDIATIAVAVGGPLEAAEVHLFKNDIDPTPTTPIGDFTEADYTGYAAEAVTWLAPTVSDAGEVEVQGIVGEFRPTASTLTNTIYGWFIDDGAGGLIASGRFEGAPFSMGSTLNNIITTPIFRPRAGGAMEVIS